MRVLRALLCAVSMAGLAACAGTNASTDAAAPSSPFPDLSQPATGLPLGRNSATSAAPAAAEPAAEPAAPPATSKRQAQQSRRLQAGYRGAATQVAAPSEPADDPEMTPEQQVYKFKGQCWMETEKQRTTDVDKRIALVDKCVAAKMKAANVKAN